MSIKIQLLAVITFVASPAILTVPDDPGRVHYPGVYSAPGPADGMDPRTAFGGPGDVYGFGHHHFGHHHHHFYPPHPGPFHHHHPTMVPPPSAPAPTVRNVVTEDSGRLYFPDEVATESAMGSEDRMMVKVPLRGCPQGQVKDKRGNCLSYGTPTLRKKCYLLFEVRDGSGIYVCVDVADDGTVVGNMSIRIQLLAVITFVASPAILAVPGNPVWVHYPGVYYAPGPAGGMDPRTAFGGPGVVYGFGYPHFGHYPQHFYLPHPGPFNSHQPIVLPPPAASAPTGKNVATDDSGRLYLPDEVDTERTRLEVPNIMARVPLRNCPQGQNVEDIFITNDTFTFGSAESSGVDRVVSNGGSNVSLQQILLQCVSTNNVHANAGCRLSLKMLPTREANTYTTRMIRLAADGGGLQGAEEPPGRGITGNRPGLTR
ncbi:hypothetical protein AAG570_003573 [Ranatra chinensis]|uniref:Uncharacterized protein n=1 Tax=Ranatra chinensis TaxID=642074 RepID=A0ABD0YQR8_9HEMI